MADKKAKGKVSIVKRKEKSVQSKAEIETERKVENNPVSDKQKENEKVKTESEDEKPKQNGEKAQGAEGGAEDEEFKLEPMELPPFEIITG